MRNMVKDNLNLSQLQNQYQCETLNAQSVVKLGCLVYFNYFCQLPFIFKKKKTNLPKIEALFVEICCIFFVYLCEVSTYYNETNR